MMNNGFRSAAATLLCGLAITIAQSQEAGAQSVEQFYKGRTVTLIVPTATGGINDLSGRLVGEAYRALHPRAAGHRGGEQAARTAGTACSTISPPTRRATVR